MKIKRICILYLCTIAALVPTGCTSITASSVDPESKQTNYFHATFFLQKNVSERIDVASKTKTTSKLIGAKNTEVSGDVEMVKALSDALGAALATGAKAAAK